MEKVTMNRKNKRGFTLVELIVVLVILAILASLLIPALTGYVTKAKKQAVITEARDVDGLREAALTECYALYRKALTTKAIPAGCHYRKRQDLQKNVGRITNGALNAIQKPNDTTRRAAPAESGRPGAEVSGERRQESALYLWQRRLINSAIKPSAYFKTKPKKTDVIIQIFHTKEGQIVAINFAKDGYMATIVPGQETTCEYDGACTSRAES